MSDMSKIPGHIAIIMDGNVRWAQGKEMPREIGYRKGVEAAEKAMIHSLKLGVKYMTLYAFSSENWGRPEHEVSEIMSVFEEYLFGDIKKLIDYGVKITFIGNRAKLSTKIVEGMSLVEKISANGTMEVRVAISYGGRDEIRNAACKFAEWLQKNGIMMDDIHNYAQKFDDFMTGAASVCAVASAGASAAATSAAGASAATAAIPDPDLMIRTSGEKRLSNFLPWELVYTELYFTDKLWPDFDTEDLDLAISDFQSRVRRYGKRV